MISRGAIIWKIITKENKYENKKSERPQRVEQSYPRDHANASRKRKYEQMREKNKVQKEGIKDFAKLKRSKLSCILCGKDHYPDRCQEY